MKPFDPRQIRFLFIISFTAVLGLLPARMSKGCGPIELKFEGYTFIKPDIINIEEGFGGQLLEFSKAFREKAKEKVPSRKDANLKEWRERFCDIPTKDDLEYVIYKASINQLRSLRSAVALDAIPLSFRLRQNSFAIHLEGEGCVEVVDYLIFAKQCEPFATTPRNRWKKNKLDTAVVNNLIDRGLRFFKRTESHYLKRRYAFQVLRLTHYSKQYKRVIVLYDKLIPRIDRKVPSILDDWMLALKAGAHRWLGERVEAAYLFNGIFMRSPNMREVALRSFYLKNDDEWQACILKCVSNEERAVMYAIRARADYSKAVYEMERIYGLDPENENLPILLIRELLKLEKDLLGLEFNDHRADNKKYFKIPRKKAPQILLDLHAFVRKVIDEQKVEELDLWKVADGYIELLSRDYYAASRTFSKIKNNLKSEALKEQVELWELVLEIVAFEEASRAVEEKAYDIILYNNLYEASPDFPDLLHDKMASLYDKAGRPGKAFLARHHIKELAINPQLDLIEDLIKAAEEVDPSKLEGLLLEDEQGRSLKSYLYDIKGTYHLNRFQFEAAAEAFREIPSAERSAFGTFNPFFERMGDCIHCPAPRDTTNFDKFSLVQRLLQLEYEGRSDFENGAYRFYDLGVALYNISYYGYDWRAADYFRSGSSWYPNNGNYVYGSYWGELGNFEFQDLSRALQYFELAIDQANERDRELAAKAAFMAARCLQKNYVNRGIPIFMPGRAYTPLDSDLSYNKYYDLLISNYRDTKFYKDIIQECLYFRAYAIGFSGE